MEEVKQEEVKDEQQPDPDNQVALENDPMEIDEQQEPGEENEQAPAQVLQQDVEIVINQEVAEGEGSDDGGEDSGEENFQ